MALTACRCPSCGANLELDDARDFGFCTFCGAKVMLHDVVEIKHTGSVTLDNSPQAKNRLMIASRAYEAGNCSEAYNYYTMVLEDIPQNIEALYKKAICAVYLSDINDVRTAEFQSGITEAAAEISRIKDTGAQEQFDADISRMLLDVVDNAQFATQFRTVQACGEQVNGWAGITQLFRSAIPVLSDGADKETLLESAIAFCNKVLGSKVTYYKETVRDKNGRETDKFATYTMSPDAKEYFENNKKWFADAYNNLPSRLQKENAVNDSLSKVSGEIDEITAKIRDAQERLNIAVKSFWTGNPEYVAAKQKLTRYGWMSGGVAVVALVIIAAILAGNQKPIGICVLLIAVVLAGTFLVVRSLRRRYDESVYTDNIKQLKKEIADAEGELKLKQKDQAKAKDAVKKFNQSKK